MSKIAVFIGIGALILVGSAEAANWSGNVKIASIEVSDVDAAAVLVSFTTSPYPSITCPSKNGQYVLDGGQPNIDKMTNIATAALVNSRTVTVYWNGSCSGSYRVLLGITLK